MPGKVSSEVSDLLFLLLHFSMSSRCRISSLSMEACVFMVEAAELWGCIQMLLLDKAHYDGNALGGPFEVFHVLSIPVLNSCYPCLEIYT